MRTNWEIREEIEKAFGEYLGKAQLKKLPARLYVEAWLDEKKEFGPWGEAGVGEDEDDGPEYFVRISLNKMVKEPEEIEETVAHEMAHLVSYERGGAGHDRLWATTLKGWGFEPKVRKALDLRAIQVWARK